MDLGAKVYVRDFGSGKSGKGVGVGKRSSVSQMLDTLVGDEEMVDGDGEEGKVGEMF